MIRYKILNKNYELIRNRIGEILITEFAYQVANFYNDDCDNVAFFVERNTPVDNTELSSIIVSFAQGKFDKHYQGGMDGHYKYGIQVFANSKKRPNEYVYSLSALKSQRLCGIVMAILGDPIYKTLGFDPGFIESVRLDSVLSILSDQQEDNLNTTSYVVVLDVDAAESVELPSGSPFEGNTTQVTLDQTDLGYQFVFDTP